MKCKRCEAELKKEDKVCPVCGEPIDAKKVEEPVAIEPEVKKANSNGDDTACLVCGILSFLGLCGVGTILAIIAIVLGSKIKKETNKMPAGMICGIISLSIQVLLTLIFISIFIVAAVLGVEY